MIESIDLATILIVFGSLIISITLHEAMHAFTSHWLGDDTAHREGRISLNPAKHVDLFGTVFLPLITLIIFKAPLLAAKPVPFNPNRVRFEEFGAALVGIAGPLTNLLLAVAGAGVANLSQGLLGVEFLQVIETFVWINIALFAFNMMPIPPLDGSRLLYAFAPEPLQKLMAGLEQFGLILVIIVVFTVPGFSEFLLGIIENIFNFLII